MLRVGSSGILIAFFVAMCGGSAVAAHRVVLVEITGGALEVRQKARAFAEQALRELGVDVVPQGRGNPAADDCAVPSCLAELGRQAGASHILEVQGSYVNESYSLRLDLRDGATGRILGSESKECEICSAKDFYRAVKDRSVALWTRVVHEQGSARMASSAAGAAGTGTPARSGSGETGTAPPARETHRALWKQPVPVIGLAFILGGSVAMGFGGHYLAVDGDSDPSCSDLPSCPYKRATARLGWELMAGGGAAVLAGVAIVLWGRDSPSATMVSLGPGRILLSGSF